MKIRYRTIFLFACSILLLNIHTILSQDRTTKIESVVTDMQGNPIQNAELFSEQNYTKTGSDGKFSISMANDAALYVKAKGYKTKTLYFNDASNAISIMLQPATFYYDDEKKINVGFGNKLYEGELIGAITQVDVAQIMAYDRTRIEGQDDFNGFLTSRTLGMLGGLTIRGFGHDLDIGSLISGGRYSSQPSLILVDGLPRDLEALRMSEIETITVLKDAHAAALYGSAAVNGVILITTKRSDATKKGSNFTATYGISTPKALPKYLSSADFMDYYNLARRNEGQSATYSDEQINNYRNGNPYRYPSIDYFSNEYLNSFKSFFDVNGEFFGGNNIAKFYANVGLISKGDIYNFGGGKDAREDMYNVRLNADLKVNDWINIENDARVVFYNNTRPRMSSDSRAPETTSQTNDGTARTYWQLANMLRPNEFTPLIPIDLIDPSEPLLSTTRRIIDGKYLLGGTSDANYRFNNGGNNIMPIANGLALGTSDEIYRIFSFNNRINFSFDRWVKGLSFHTNISFDFLSGWEEMFMHTYAVYYPTWDNNDRITELTMYGEDSRSSTKGVVNTWVRRRLGGYGMFSYDRTFSDVHNVKGNLLGYASMYKRTTELHGIKATHLGLQLTYTYDKRYMVDFSGVFLNSPKLAPGHRTDFAPTFGAAWVISNEDFMSSVNGLDYLKLRATGGIIKSDLNIANHYLYNDRYAQSGGTVYWNDGQRSRSALIASQGRNDNLGYLDRKDMNIGIEAMLLNKSFGVEVNWFNTLLDGFTGRPTNIFPSFYDQMIPYENYGATRYKGVEAGLNYTMDKKEWTLSAGINMLYSDAIRTKVVETRAYDYMKREGQPAFSRWGMEALGFFESQEEINTSPTQWGTLLPGDIKYKDQNGDGRIDDNDEVYIGRSQAPFSTGLHLMFSYKNFTFMMLGEGRFGSTGYLSSDYYWVDGTKKYSEIVKNTWTPETRNTATYPRLTTGTNTNNHRSSSFWLYNSDYYDITRIQVTYRMPESISKFMFMKNWDWFAYVTTPFQFSQNQDIRNLSTSNTGPNYRSYVLGLKVGL